MENNNVNSLSVAKMMNAVNSLSVAKMMNAVNSLVAKMMNAVNSLSVAKMMNAVNSLSVAKMMNAVNVSQSESLCVSIWNCKNNTLFQLITTSNYRFLTQVQFTYIPANCFQIPTVKE